MKPTIEQMEHFFRLVGEGRVTGSNFQAFLEKPGQYFAGFPVTYNQALGLAKLIRRAVGKRNFGNINSDITPERFPLKGTDVRQVKLRVEPFLNSETGEEAAKRLTAAGRTLANTGDLAGFLHDHPEEVKKWNWVAALSEDSRWSNPGGRVYVPYAHVSGANRRFSLDIFRYRFNSDNGVLVLCE